MCAGGTQVPSAGTKLHNGSGWAGAEDAREQRREILDLSPLPVGLLGGLPAGTRIQVLTGSDVGMGTQEGLVVVLGTPMVTGSATWQVAGDRGRGGSGQNGEGIGCGR